MNKRNACHQRASPNLFEYTISSLFLPSISKKVLIMEERLELRVKMGVVKEIGELLEI